MGRRSVLRNKRRKEKGTFFGKKSHSRAREHFWRENQREKGEKKI